MLSTLFRRLPTIFFTTIPSPHTIGLSRGNSSIFLLARERIDLLSRLRNDLRPLVREIKKIDHDILKYESELSKNLDEFKEMKNKMCGDISSIVFEKHMMSSSATCNQEILAVLKISKTILQQRVKTLSISCRCSILHFGRYIHL